jgi:ankyrin repeat protein
MTLKHETRLLIDAVRNGSVDAARGAIDAGAYISVRDEEDRTPLHWAADSGDVAMVQLLLEKGADINVKDRWECTPLKGAAQSLCTEIVQMLRDASEGHVGRVAERRDCDGEPKIGR